MSLRYHLIYYAVACLLGVLIMLIHPVFLVLLIIYAFFIIRHFGWERLVTIGLVMIFFLVFIRWPQPTDEPIISGYIIDVYKRQMFRSGAGRVSIPKIISIEWR